MKYLGIGNLNKHILFPLLVPLFYIIRDISFKRNFSKQFTERPLFETLLMFISEIICIPFELMRRHNSKPREKEKRITVENNQFVDNNKVIVPPANWKEPKIYFFIAVSSVIDLICFTSISFSCAYDVIQTHNIHTEMRILPIFFMGFLSWKFLHMRIYIHHLFSVLLIGFGFIIILVDLFMSINIAIFQMIFILLFYFIIHFLYSVKQINDKYLMEKKYISPFLLLFFEGVFGIILTLVTYGIAYFIPCKAEWPFCSDGPIFESLSTDMLGLVDGGTPISLLYLLLMLFSSCGLNIFLMFTKNYFSPTHRSVSDTMNAFFAWIANFYFGWNDIVWDYFNVVGFVIIMIGCCLFNEIIIFKCCGLDNDTKESIVQRADIENLEYIEAEPIQQKQNELNSLPNTCIY